MFSIVASIACIIQPWIWTVTPTHRVFTISNVDWKIAALELLKCCCCSLVVLLHITRYHYASWEQIKWQILAEWAQLTLGFVIMFLTVFYSIFFVGIFRWAFFLTAQLSSDFLFQLTTQQYWIMPFCHNGLATLVKNPLKEPTVAAPKSSNDSWEENSIWPLTLDSHSHVKPVHRPKCCVMLAEKLKAMNYEFLPPVQTQANIWKSAFPLL